MSLNDRPNSGNRQITAGAYVLGLLDAAERAAVEDQLSIDEALAHETGFWNERLFPLAAAGVGLKPSEATFKAVMAAVDGVPQPRSTTVRASTEGWETLSQGVHKKRLLADHESGTESFYLRIEPGGVVQAHSHRGTEECLVIEGEMVIGKARFAAGDYHAAPAGSMHLPITAPGGALLFIRAALAV